MRFRLPPWSLSEVRERRTVVSFLVVIVSLHRP